MHDCPACGLACDCDGEDTFMDAEACVHPGTFKCSDAQDGDDFDFDDREDD